MIQLASLNLIRSGLYNYSNGNISSPTLIGYYWSSRLYSLANSYYLILASSNLYPWNSYDRSYGFALRCLAR